MKASTLTDEHHYVLARLRDGHRLSRVSEQWYEFVGRPKRMVHAERIEQLIALGYAMIVRRSVEITDDGRAVARQGVHR